MFEQFVVRDLLGYIVPGCITATALALCAPVADVDHLAVTTSLAKLTFASLVLFYLCGFVCSAVGDLTDKAWTWIVRHVLASRRRQIRPGETEADKREDSYDAASIVDDIVASGMQVSRRYIARLQDIGLMAYNAGVALLAVVLARLFLVHESYSAASGMGPFATAYRCMTLPIIVAMVLAAGVLMWFGQCCIRDADARTRVVALKIDARRRENPALSGPAAANEPAKTGAH
ncbi:MAG: hypothetical protein WAT39_00410 [Planctomycetota bacterium]